MKVKCPYCEKVFIIPNQNNNSQEDKILENSGKVNKLKEQIELLNNKYLRLQESINKERESYQETLSEKIDKSFENGRKSVESELRTRDARIQQLENEIKEVQNTECAIEIIPSIDEINQIIEDTNNTSTTYISRGVKIISVIHDVFLRSENCGKIIYAIKDTKTWGSDWIDKMKEDKINKKADHAIIVSNVFPKDMNVSSFCNYNDIWICKPNCLGEFVRIIVGIIQYKKQISESSDKNEKDKKLKELSKYITSADFINNAKMIVEKFNEYHQLIEKDHKAQQNEWRKQDKARELAFQSINNLFSGLKEISGQNLPMLEYSP